MMQYKIVWNIWKWKKINQNGIFWRENVEDVTRWVFLPSPPPIFTLLTKGMRRLKKKEEN